MRKILAVLSAALALSASAAWERVGSLQVADMAVVGQSVGSLGMMCGNPMASAALAASVADMRTLKFFGPMRPGASMVFSVFMDGETLAAKKSGDAALQSLEYAILYPMAKSRAEFMKMHSGSFETNGLVVVRKPLDSDQTNDTTYVAFSADGLWVGASDRPEQAAAALADVETALQPMDGDVVRVRVNESGINAVATALEKSEDANPRVLTLVKGVSSCACGVRIGEKGVDIRARVKPVAGSELAKVGQIPLPDDPLAFAGKSGIAVQSTGPDCGNFTADLDALWPELTKILDKQGLALDTFVSRAKVAGGDRLTFDLAALVKMFDELDSRKKTFDVEMLAKDLLALEEDKPFAAKGPACAYAFGVRGFESAWPVSERFAATLPEATALKPCEVKFISITSLFKALVPVIVEKMPEERRAAMGPALAAMVVESKGGIASAAWSDADSFFYMVRISADEIRGVGNIFNAAVVLMTQGAATETDDAGTDDAGDEDDADDDSDDED